ncbi:hypothetical protein L3Q82_020899, partial [Scortum barcoo]
LGEFVKGTVQSVIADNLGAHGIAGFIESFSGVYFCRFCTGELNDLLWSKERVFFSPRIYLIVMLLGATLLTLSMTYLMGVVPVEIALCIGELISKKYLSLDTLNKLILNFPYKWGDRTNKPHIISHTLHLY